MFVISHRGNTEGKKSSIENHPDVIKNLTSKAIDVEIDIWFQNNKLFLGHDGPDYEIPFSFLSDQEEYLWIHCKDLQTMEYMNRFGDELNYFYHTREDVVLTSQNHLWYYPQKITVPMDYASVMVLPEYAGITREEALEKNVWAVCTDLYYEYAGKVC